MAITQVLESKLQLNFSLEHDVESGDRLMMNNMQIYPLDLQSSSNLEPLTASLMTKGNDKTWNSVGSPVLGYSLSIKHPVQLGSDENNLNMVSIHIEIVEVADKFLSGLPTIDLKLLETPSHKLMIGAAEVVAPVHRTPGSEDGCTTLTCRWRAIIADRLAQIQALKAQALKKVGCGGKGKGQAHGQGRPGRPAGRPNWVPTTPGHNKHHGHHSQGPEGSDRTFRHHHRHGSVARFLRGIVIHVLLPVLMGVMVGITASLIGMVVGHIAIFLWRITFRRGQRAECGKYAGVAQTDSTETSDSEEKSFLGHQGPPPEYEVVIVDEKTEIV